MVVLQTCLRCSAALREGPTTMACPGCGSTWPVVDGVPRYASSEYFGEIEREDMRRLVATAAKAGWLEAVKALRAHDPVVYESVADLNRASWMPLLALDAKSTVLDVGAGLGALTHALALHYERVVAVEPVEERVAFTKLRVDQEGLENVDVVQSTVKPMPFVDGTFDLIVLNGILEWVGAWFSTANPRDAQREVLRYLRRLLTPRGILVLGIENRIGYDFFLGRIDHPGSRFTSLMPRSLASLYLRLTRPGFHRSAGTPRAGYRTYTYSLGGYRKLLGEAGLAVRDVWWPVGGYGSPYLMIRADARRDVREHFDWARRYRDRINGYSIVRRAKDLALVRSGAVHAMLPDFVILATAIGRSQEIEDGARAPISAVLTSAQAARGGHVESLERCQPSVLMTHPFRNKTVVTTRGAKDVVVKMASVRRPDADVVERSAGLLNELARAFENGPRVLRRSIPAMVEFVQTEGYVASVESIAHGTRFDSLCHAVGYFRDRARVQRHLGLLQTWLAAAAPALAEVLGAQARLESAAQPRVAGAAEERGAPTAIADETIAQHGDLYPENVFIDEARGTVCVIDWDQAGRGYPRLFDWFCLVTGMFYTHRPVRSLFKGRAVEEQSFRETYFEASWFSETVGELTRALGRRHGLDANDVKDCFREYLLTRYRQFDRTQSGQGQDACRRQYRGFHAYFLEHQDRFAL